MQCPSPKVLLLGGDTANHGNMQTELRKINAHH
jgi:hypothetical protein